MCVPCVSSLVCLVCVVCVCVSPLRIFLVCSLLVSPCALVSLCVLCMVLWLFWVLVACLLYVCAYGLSLLLVLLSSACVFLLWFCIPPLCVRSLFPSMCLCVYVSMCGVLPVVCRAFGCWGVLCLGGVVILSFVLCFRCFCV